MEERGSWEKQEEEEEEEKGNLKKGGKKQPRLSALQYHAHF